MNPELAVDEKYREKINAILTKISNLDAKISSKLHIWWAKKPGNVIEQLLLHFTEPNEIVLDPFSGSGTVLEETIKLNRKCIALDINPLSIFIMKNLISKKNWRAIEKKYNIVIDNLKKQSTLKEFSNIYLFYDSKCPECNEIGKIHYVVWHQETPSSIRMECKNHGILTKDVIDKQDLDLISKIENIQYDSKLKNNKFIRNSRINISKDMYLKDFFTKRNFITLSMLLNQIELLENSTEQDFLKFILSSTLRKTSNLIGTKGGLSVGFWIPKKNRKENNVFLQLEKTRNKIFNQIEYLNKLSQHDGIAKDFSELLSEKSALIQRFNVDKLNLLIDSDSVDLIITDPPYADEVPYLELSQLWNFFFNFQISSNDYEEEIILTNSPERPRKKAGTQAGLDDYYLRLYNAFTQMYHVLKQNHFACIWFHEAELKIWNILIQAALNTGFHYLDQINVSTTVRSLKPKFSPKHSLTGHVLIFFVKLDNKPIFNDPPEWQQIEKLIIEQGRKIIQKNNGKASTSELYNGLGAKEEGIIAKLIKNNALEEVSKKYNNLFSFFKKNYKFNDENHLWSIK